MIRPVRLYGDPLLTAICEKVDRIGPEELKILTDMEDTMACHHCIGLSAPQIGVTKRLFIVHAAGTTIRGANPEILSEGAMVEDIEGSPCLPGIQRPVRRPKKIRCRYQNEDGNIVETELRGLPARVFCHETDHHNGILFIDRLKPSARRLLQPELDKLITKQQS